MADANPGDVTLVAETPIVNKGQLVAVGEEFTIDAANAETLVAEESASKPHARRGRKSEDD